MYPKPFGNNFVINERTKKSGHSVGKINVSESRALMSKELLVGGVAQVATCALMNPFDVIRMRLQSRESNFSITRTTQELASLPLRHGLYRGFVFNVASLAPARAGYLAVYTRVRSRLVWLGHTLATTIAATAAVSAVCFVMNPIWVVRTRLMTSTGVSTPSAAGVIRNIVTTHGVRGLYAGLMVTLVGRTAESAAYWLIYEPWRAVSKSTRGAATTTSTSTPLLAPSSSSSQETPSPPTPSPTNVTTARSTIASALTTASTSAFAKSLAVACVYPYHVVVTRIRQNPLPPRDPAVRLSTFLSHRAAQVLGVLTGATRDSVAAAVCERTGATAPRAAAATGAATPGGKVGTLSSTARARYVLRGAYTGLSVHLARAVPSTVVFFVLYEGLLALTSSD